MARKKIEMAAISFRLPSTLKADIEDLAASASQDVSSILIELIVGLVAANRPRIEDFRRTSSMPLQMPSFSTTPPSSKPARASKKNPAQIATEPKGESGGGDSQ